MIQRVKVNLIPSYQMILPVIHLKQYDKTETNIGKQIELELYSGDDVYEIPSGTTVTFQGTKLDKTGYQYEVTNVSGNLVTVDIKDQMTVLSGRHYAELRISKDGTIINSTKVLMDIDSSALEDDTVISETDLPLIEEGIEAISTILDTAKQVATDAKSASTSASNAKTSETNASKSEANAKTYASNAKTSETNSKTSETNAKASETNAKTSETNASKSETNAKAYEEDAKQAIDEIRNVAGKSAVFEELDPTSTTYSYRHDLSTKDLIIQCYTIDGTDLNPTVQRLDGDNIKLTFNEVPNAFRTVIWATNRWTLNQLAFDLPIA